MIAVGKIHDIFDGEGITQTYHSDSPVHGMQQTADIMEHSEFEGLCFVNLVDFDAVWGIAETRKDMQKKWSSLMKSWENCWN